MGVFRTTTGEELPLTQRESKLRRRRLWFFLPLFFVALLATGTLVKIHRYAQAQGYVTTENYAEVRPPVTGIVSKILIRSGQSVQAGQLLVQLNAEEEEALLAETKARVLKLKSELQRRQAEMFIDLERRSVDLAEQKRAHGDNISIAVLQLKNAQTKLKLTQELVERGLKAATNLEDDALKEQLTRVSLESLRNKDFTIYETLLQRDKDKYDQEMVALRNEVAALEDAVRRVEARLRIREIRAPISGIVVRYEFVIGELLQPSNVIYEIFGGEKQVLKLRVAERHATKISIGNSYRARLSSYKGLNRIYFRGKVEYLRNVIQMEGQETYRTAYCSFEADGKKIPPGTTAEARIYYGKSCLWFYLFNLDF